MTIREPASLTDALLVVKGAAQPLRFGGRRERRVSKDTRPRISIRIDEVHHRRLRLAAAHAHKTLHAVLADALHHYLDEVAPGLAEPSCVCLARSPSAEAGGVMPFRTP